MQSYLYDDRLHKDLIAQRYAIRNEQIMRRDTCQYSWRATGYKKQCSQQRKQTLHCWSSARFLIVMRVLRTAIICTRACSANRQSKSNSTGMSDRTSGLVSPYAKP